MGRLRFSALPRPLPTPSTLTPNQTNDLELVTLARIDKTPALQANKASPLRECEKKSLNRENDNSALCQP